MTQFDQRNQQVTTQNNAGRDVNYRTSTVNKTIKKGQNPRLFLIGIAILVLVVGGVFAWPHIFGNGSGPSFSDAFADNNQGWNASTGAGGNATISNHELSLRVSSDYLILPLPTHSAYSDFSFTVDVTLDPQNDDPNNGVGIRVSNKEQGMQGDYVKIFTTNTGYVGEQAPGSYSIFTLSDQVDPFTTPPSIVQRTPTLILHPDGTQNEMTLLKKGSNFALLLNGQTVTTFGDSDLGSTYISLFLYGGGLGTRAAATVQKVTLTSAPASLPQSSS